LSYSGQTIANVDHGPAGVERGRIEISGWATSPNGIDHVDICVANHQVIRRAARTDRNDVTAVLPWHPPVYGFALTLPTPPRIARGDTDLQVDVVDRRGGHRLLSPMWFRWLPHPRPPRAWNVPATEALLRRLKQDPSKTLPALRDGRASIEDFTGSLVTDPLVTTDLEFVRESAAVLYGDEQPWVVLDPYVRSITRGTSRERIISAMIHSAEFRRRYELH
jgi:hypothetical protein